MDCVNNHNAEAIVKLHKGNPTVVKAHSIKTGSKPAEVLPEEILCHRTLAEARSPEQ